MTNREEQFVAALNEISKMATVGHCEKLLHDGIPAEEILPNILSMIRIKAENTISQTRKTMTFPEAMAIYEKCHSDNWIRSSLGYINDGFGKMLNQISEKHGAIRCEIHIDVRENDSAYVIIEKSDGFKIPSKNIEAI